MKSVPRPTCPKANAMAAQTGSSEYKMAARTGLAFWILEQRKRDQRPQQSSQGRDQKRWVHGS